MLATWLRWLFFGKTLEERLAKLEKVQDEFEYHAKVARARKSAKEFRIALLQQQTSAHTVEIERAELVAENFRALRTQRLATDPEYEPL